MIWSMTSFAASTRACRSSLELAANALVASMKPMQIKAIFFFISYPFERAPKGGAWLGNLCNKRQRPEAEVAP